MSARRIGIVLGTLGLLGAALGACSGSDPRPPPASGIANDDASSPGGSASTSSDAGGASGEAGASGSGGAGAPNSSQSSGGAGDGSGGAEAAGVCGDSMVADNEDCEPGEFTNLDCVGFGYDEGQVSCRDDCSYDFSDCTGVERCFDAADNDGDGDEDCEDEDCAEACSSSCDQVPELIDGSSVRLDNTGHASELSLACVGSDAGPELVYRVEATTTGILDATIDTGGFPELSVALRESCDDDDSELTCASVRASAPVTQGDIVYVVVQGTSDTNVGDFELVVSSRGANQCGDGFWDDLEACDDAETLDGDGCDSDCNVESTETEPNDSPENANTRDGEFYGEISPQGDVDVVAIEITDDASYVVLNTYTLAAGGCGLELFDPFLELLDSDGTTVVAENDDYNGTCARVIAEDIDAGTYYVRVSESPNSIGLRSEFPYWLGVTIDFCGNGVWGPLEECDDGNAENGDGCSGRCETE